MCVCTLDVWTSKTTVNIEVLRKTMVNIEGFKIVKFYVCLYFILQWKRSGTAWGVAWHGLAIRSKTIAKYLNANPCRYFDTEACLPGLYRSAQECGPNSGIEALSILMPQVSAPKWTRYSRHDKILRHTSGSAPGEGTWGPRGVRHPQGHAALRPVGGDPRPRLFASHGCGSGQASSTGSTSWARTPRPSCACGERPPRRTERWQPSRSMKIQQVRSWRA